MEITHCSVLLLSIISVKGISAQYYSQVNPNNRYYSAGYNGNYNGNYGNLNPSFLRYPEAAVRPGELIVEVNEPPGQTPCRNKDANKDHKDSLWWTLPIPPMELEGPPERPQQVKQPEPAQQVEEVKPQQMNSVVETGAIQQKHSQVASPTSTAKAQVAPAAPTPQAVVQVATTAKHEVATSAPSKQDRAKTAQIQKQQQQQQQQQAPVAVAQQTQPQSAVPVPNQLVVSNKDTNQQQMIANKSVATMRSPGRPAAPIPPHGANKQKVMLNMNMIDPVRYQYPQEVMQMPQAYMNPYFNPQYLREPPQLAPNRGYRGDMINSMAELADSMYKNFDTNDAEIGGGGVVGDSPLYGMNQANPNMLQYENNFSPLEQPNPEPWAALSEDERNKRNPFDNTYRQKAAIS